MNEFLTDLRLFWKKERFFREPDKLGGICRAEQSSSIATHGPTTTEFFLCLNCENIHIALLFYPLEYAFNQV